MSRKKKTPTASNTEAGLDRRDFINLGLLGAVVPLTMGAASATNSEEITSEGETLLQEDAPPVPPVNPYTAIADWDEPWVWQVSRWPGEPLQLQVVEHQSPTTLIGFGNPVLFSYNGFTPGPTIRMRGDETLRVKLINNLGLNGGKTYIGANTDPGIYIGNQNLDNPQYLASLKAGLANGTIKYLPDWLLGEHVNGFHSARTTNLHTHGLHVRPGTNEDNTHSDDIYVRIIPREDYDARVNDQTYTGPLLLEKEQVAEADYEFRLGMAKGKKIAPHPPGTHWYHPHTHGATHNQVASGMAGFLIVEGDVDEAINQLMTGRKSFDTTLPTVPYQYRERLMLVQRVLISSKDADAPTPRLQNASVNAANGKIAPQVLEMRPGAVERWRFLNGSVDGKGYVRFMVLKGQWVSENGTPGVYKSADHPPQYGEYESIKEKLEKNKQLLFVDTSEGKNQRQLPSTWDIEQAKQQLYQLSMDGVTLVRQNNYGAEYFLKDLSNDNKNPLYQPYTNLGTVYENEKNLKAVYNLPNELYMAPANRADFFFQAPKLASPEVPEVYTIVAKGTAIHTENLQRAFQLTKKYDLSAPAVPGDTIIGYLIVKGDAVERFDISRLSDTVSKVPVPDYLKPVTQDELKIPESEAAAKGDPGLKGKYRTRKVTYSGWGNATWPLLYKKDLKRFDPGKPLGDIDKTFLYNTSDDTKPYTPDLGTVVVGPNTRTMAIDGKKFDPEDATAPKVLQNTREEWVVCNNSISLWGTFPEIDPRLTAEAKKVGEALTVAQENLALAQKNDDPEKIKKCQDEVNTLQNQLNKLKGAITFYRDHLPGYALTRKGARDRNQTDITTRGIDHPFHVHTNPFWLMRVEVPDEEGNLVNILPEPRWNDVIWVPRNAGRVVFRSRYPDYTGKLVNHCHILQHEDNGMMQEVEIVRDPKKSNYQAVSQVSDPKMQPTQVSDLGGPYAKQILQKAYEDCSRVIDHNHKEMAISYEFPAKNGVFKAPKV